MWAKVEQSYQPTRFSCVSMTFVAPFVPPPLFSVPLLPHFRPNLMFAETISTEAVVDLV